MHRVMRLTIALFCFLVGLKAALGQGTKGPDIYDGHPGTNRIGSDIEGMPIQLVSARACGQVCSERDDCAAWAYGGNGTDQFLSGTESADQTKIDASEGGFCYLKYAVPEPSLAEGFVSGVSTKISILRPKPHSTLNVGEIQPRGWINRQLQYQVMGLAGHLQLFWDDVAHSVWIGGQHDGGLSERMPYWLNGAVVLSRLANNETFSEQVKAIIRYIVANQSDDGWFGPPQPPNDGEAYWGRMPFLLALVSFYEGYPEDSVELNVFRAIYKQCECMFNRMIDTPFSSWSAARWYELAYVSQWLWDKIHTLGIDTHDIYPQVLWDVMSLAHVQGYNWPNFWLSDQFPRGAVTTTNLFTHGVNNGQALKSIPIISRFSQDAIQDCSGDVEDFRTQLFRSWKTLLSFHGQASGIFAGDEHLAGKSPVRGTELCTIVEVMWSFAVATEIFGVQSENWNGIWLADALERVAFNALPMAITPDMWAHQYLELTNQGYAVYSDPHTWTNDGPDSILYGLAPNYGCCTVNFGQGYPKMITRAAYLSSDIENPELFLVLLIPVRISTKWGVIDVDTLYPQSDIVNITANLTSSQSLKINVRIPGFVTGASISLDGQPLETVKNGTMYSMNLLPGVRRLQLTLNSEVELQYRFNGAVSVTRGPLVYGLALVENFTVLEQYAYDSRDYQVEPGAEGTPWNVAIDRQSLRFTGSNFQEKRRHQKSDLPQGQCEEDNIPGNDVSHLWSKLGTNVWFTALGYEVPSWRVKDNAADVPPRSPVENVGSTALNVTLLPIGATDIRMTEMPYFN